MKKKKCFFHYLIIFILIVTNLVTGILLTTGWIKDKRLVSDRIPVVSEETTVKMSNKSMDVLEEDNKMKEINPIDYYYENRPACGFTPHMRAASYLYYELWKKEFDHVMIILKEKGHADIQEELTRLEESIGDYAEARANILSALSCSSAFQDEYKDNDRITYATLSLVESHQIRGQVYREFTLKIYGEYSSLVGVEDFIFDFDALTEKEKEILTVCK